MAFRNYPLVTPEGVPIPTDVLGPIDALAELTVTSAAFGAAIALPSYDATKNVIFLEVWATVDCQIGFTSTPVDGVTTKGIYRLRADDPRLVVPSDGYISAVATNGDEGTLFVNILDLWESARKDYQTEVGE